MKRRIFFCSLLVSVLAACSTIREDRSVCPCWCSIDFTDVDSSSVKELRLWFFASDGRLLCRDTLYSGEYDNHYEIELERGAVNYYVWGNMGGNTVLDDNSTLNATLLKRQDTDADSLYYYGKRLDASGENCVDTVMMHKEHSVVTIVLLGGYSGKEPLYMEIVGNTAGYYINRGFLEGGCEILLPPAKEWDGRCEFEFKILRQSALEELCMVLHTVNENGEKITNTFPLGMWLLDMGYDMTDENMSDILVELDLAMGYAFIKVEDWQETEPVRIIM